MSKMKDLMAGYYDEMKKEMGVFATLDVEDDDPKLDKFMESLKKNRNIKMKRTNLYKKKQDELKAKYSNV